MKQLKILIVLGALLFVELLFAAKNQKFKDYDQLLFVVSGKKFYYRDLVMTGKAVATIHSHHRNFIFFDLFSFGPSYLKKTGMVSVATVSQNKQFWQKTLSVEIFYLDLIEQKNITKKMLSQATDDLEKYGITSEDPLYRTELKILVTAYYLKKRYGQTSRAYTSGDFALLKRENPKLSDKLLRKKIEQQRYIKTVEIAKDFIQFAQSRFKIESFF